MNNRNNLIFLFAFFLFSVGLVTLLMSHRNFEKIKMTYWQTPLLFKNEPGFLFYKIENPQNKHRYMIQAQNKVVEHLKPFEIRDLQISFLPLHYGVQEVPMVCLESRFPLQFLRVWRHLQPDHKIVVYPEKINYIAALEKLPEDNPGQQRSKKNQPIEKEISHFDKFQQSDSLQDINWKMLAKTSELYVKKFESLAADQKNRVLRWSETESLNDIEKRKSQFAYWIDHFYKSKLPFTVEFEEQQIDVALNDYKSLVKALRLLL